MPIINCKKEHLPFKSEVTYWFKQHEIDVNNLICIDEIDMDKNVQNFVLVDHHVSPYHEKVLAVIDHRPYDEKTTLEEECSINIQQVGSCATLVMEAIKNDINCIDDENLLHFLYGPIILDTINYSKEADKVTELDVKMTEIIEKTLKIDSTETTRSRIFKTLVEARADVSALNSEQILSKDLKIVSNKAGNVKVAMSGVHVFEYPSMNDSAENIRKFAQQENVDVVMLMGMKPSGKTVERQLAVINIKNKLLYHHVLETVESMKNPDLQLVLQDIQFAESKFYQQQNAKASRKQILPVIRDLLQSY